MERLCTALAKATASATLKVSKHSIGKYSEGLDLPQVRADLDTALVKPSVGMPAFLRSFELLDAKGYFLCPTCDRCTRCAWQKGGSSCHPHALPS